MFRKVVLLLSLTLGAEVSMAPAGDLGKAELLRKHNLTDDAKRELIDLLTSQASPQVKAEALYALGSIAFEESNITVALDSWTRLVRDYPAEAPANRVKDRIAELAEIIGETSKTTVDNAVAQSYLRHGDFWSDNKSRIFQIDASWIPKVEAAVKWYDKVIAEFPGTTAARVAFEDKMRALLGWKEIGQYSSSYGIRQDYKKYIGQLEDTFRAFGSAFPEASTIQAFRFQIAQAHWSNKNWLKTREWLNAILKAAGDGDSFYKDLAQRRLEKVEY